MEENGVVKLVAMGKCDAKRRTIVISNLPEEVLAKLREQKPGGYFLACIRTREPDAGVNPVIEIPDASLLFPIGMLVKRKTVA